MHSLVNTIFFSKMKSCFSKIFKMKELHRGFTLLLSKPSSGRGKYKPTLYWNKEFLEKALHQPANHKSITTINIANAIRHDHHIASYFKDVEIPFGANITVPPLETRSELLMIKLEKIKKAKDKLETVDQKQRKRKRGESVQRNAVEKRQKKTNANQITMGKRQKT